MNTFQEAVAVSRWPVHCAGDLVRITMGQSPPGATYNAIGNGLPFFQGKAQFGDIFPVATTWCTLPIRTAEPDDILISVRAPVGPTNRALTRCCIGRGLASLRTISPLLDQDFLHWKIKKLEPVLMARGSGSTFQAIGRKDIATLPIPLPPLDEQRRIVEVLERAAGIRRLREQALEKARALIPALFLDMFGDPVGNPLGFHKTPLSSLCEVSYGLADKLDTSLGPANGDRIITISNVTIDGELDPAVARYHEVERAKRDRFQALSGDLLFNWRNGSASHVGKTAMVPQELSGSMYVSFLLRLRAFKQKAEPSFIWALLNLLRSRQFFSKTSREQINRKFNAKELSELKIVAPSISLQQRFAERVADIRAIIARQERSLAAARALERSLMARLLG